MARQGPETIALSNSPVNSMRTAIAALAARRRQANFAGFAACAAMMGFALFVQYVLKHQPCSMCILQRLATIALGLTFLVAALHNPRAWGAKVYGTLMPLIAAAGMSVSIRQLWIMAQPKGSVPTCGAGFYETFTILPFHEALGTVFRGGGDCQDDSFTLLGLPFPAGVLICLLVLSAWAVHVNLTRPGLDKKLA